MESNRKTVSREAMQEEWLLIKAAQTDPARFRPLYDRYYHDMFRFVFRRVGEESDTADICSKIFLKSLQRIKSYEFKGVPFSAWLYRIASNEVAQHYRDKSKTRVVSVESFTFANLAEEMKENDHPDYRKALLHALDQIRPGDLQLIELRFFEQRPFKEIATILEITESNAKIRTYRILERLKKIILKDPGTKQDI